jgi:hypothetical protein
MGEMGEMGEMGDWLLKYCAFVKNVKVEVVLEHWKAVRI